VKLKRKKSATLVQLSHQRLGTSAKWENVRREVQEGWTSSLENLASVLKTGEDLRFLRRPMVGIGLSDFNEEIASHLNVPVTKGIRIDTVVDGMGAQAAGLQGNDVIVRMAGQDITDWSSLNNVLESHHAGDKIEVVFYRGADQKTVVMELSRRPLPELAQDVPALAKVSRKRQDTIQAEMDEFFKDVSEKEASFKPAPDEWSAKEVLAHLIQGERYYQIWITELAGRQEGHHDDWTGNLQAPIDATLAAYPSLADMRQEYKRSCNETVALIANLPKEFQTHKGSFWRLAYSEADSPYHHRIHMEQMGAAIAAARNASK
jgi:PDZ domain/DinB superfamily